MKQLTEIAKRKVIALVSAVNVEETTVRHICTDLRDRGFKPPHGRHWTESKLIEVMAVPEEKGSKLITCPMCRQRIDSDSRICPECWSKL